MKCIISKEGLLGDCPYRITYWEWGDVTGNTPLISIPQDPYLSRGHIPVLGLGNAAEADPGRSFLRTETLSTSSGSIKNEVKGFI